MKYKHSMIPDMDADEDESEEKDYSTGVLCILKKDHMANCVFNLKSDDTVQFLLTKGTGPVYLFG